MSVMNMLPGGSTMQIPLDAPTSFSATAGNAQVELTWTDPLDKYATPEGEVSETGDQLVSEWDHTVLVRKTGSQPAGPNDGTVVVSSSVRNQYQSSAYVDSGLTNDTTYYYGVFAYNKDGVASPGAFTTATPKASTPISSLSEGALIKMNENGAPVEFYVSKINYEEGLNGAGRTLVVRKDVYDQRQWNNSNVNAWASCTMRSWLNSTYKALLDADIQEAMGTTTYRYTPGNGISTVATRSDAVFLLSLTELGQSNRHANVEGSALPIASTLQIAYQGGSATTQWTRSPSTNLTDYTWRLSSNGDSGRSGCAGTSGSRPAFTLPSTVMVDEDMNVIA